MRTENYKHGVVSLMLVFALVFSVVTIAAPLASAGDWTNRPAPGGTIIQVVAGENFLIRHQLEYNSGTDNVDNDGAYTVTISWLNYENKENENFTFLMAEAYFTSGSHSGQSEQADVTLSSAPAGADTTWALSVKRPADSKTTWNGQFNVDIWLGAWGVGGVPHSADASEHGDNHPIPPSGDQLGGVIVIEPGLDSWARAPITVDIIGVGVDVDVTPDFQEDWTGNDLVYTVTVTNTGELADNFVLTPSDNSGWTLDVSPSTLEIAASGSDTATLTVTVGTGTDNVTVTATGTYASGSDSVIAKQKEGPNVLVDVEPEYQSAVPPENFTYSVVVTNIGTVPDNYTVTVADDAGWNPHFSVVDLLPTDDAQVNDDNIYANAGSATTMYVGTYFATGENDRCFAQFDLSTSGIPGGSTINSATLNAYDYNGTFSVDIVIDAKRVDNDAWDESTITWNNAPWGDVGAVLDTDVCDTVGGWNSWDVTGFVVGEFAGDNLVSILLQSENEGVGDSAGYTTKDSGYAEKIYLSVNYTPPGGYIVSLNPGENDTRTLYVEMPESAVPSTVDNITVTAQSQENVFVQSSDTVQAHAEAAVAVDVLPIDPQLQEQHANKSLNYSVTIVNEGAAPDNFDVVLDDTEGWNPTWDITVQLLPTDDSGVSSAFPDSVEDGGVDYNTYNGWTPTYGAQRNYFKFDISAVPHGSWIKSATFWATGRYGPSWPGYTDTWHLVDARTVEDDSWEESTLTWNNAPAMGSVLDTENFAGDLFVPQWTWLSWDVTDFVADEMLVNQLATIGLKAQVEDNTIHPNGGSAGWFRTKDGAPWWAQYKPYLEITYMPGVSDTTTVYGLGPGENVTLYFGVTVPADVIPSTVDNISVTATSQTNGAVSDVEYAGAHAGLLRYVEAQIVGPVYQETHKDPLTYVIEIHNTGQIADMYKLTAYDKRDWPLLVEPQEIYLKPSHTAQAALSVTIPYQTLGSVVDNIWVTIEGKLASGTFSDPENSYARVDVQAHSREVWGVDLEVYPSIHQTGHPDSPLTWLVTVTNTGNVPDIVSLDLIDQYVYDLVGVYPDWAGGFQPGDLTHMEIPLEAYEEVSILLTLTVPDTEDMRTGVHNEITIGATSLGSYEEDSQVVVAQVRQQMPHVPQGEIKLQAVAGYVAIDIWPTYYDFGVLNEMDIAATPPDYFTVRNVGNVYVDVTIVGMDATSKPGEPAAKWTLSGTAAIGVDMYALWWTVGGDPVNTVAKEEKILTSFLEPGNETYFDLMIQAPSTFTTPAKMWTKVAITARKLHPQPQ